jgi:16S rRNA (uracil1498-N3)-methyltransferase
VACRALHWHSSSANYGGTLPAGNAQSAFRNVNLILFALSEIDRPLPRTDRRAVHLLDVLHRREGGTFDAGLINGPRGKATVRAITADAVWLDFAWGPPLPPVPTLALLIGLPRPQTARAVLRDATTLGATALHFVRTEKGDPNYAQSTLWSSGEWRRHLLAGAEQAFDPRIPEVRHGATLLETLAILGDGDGARVALDNYESPYALSAVAVAPGSPVVLAFGAERGWSERERLLLREHGFALAHLGERVLRTETAVVAALALVRPKQGSM